MNDPQHTPRTVVIGAGPAGLTAACGWRGAASSRSSSRRTHRWAASPDRRIQGLPLRHRRPPLLLQGRRGRAALARDARRPSSSPGRGCSRIYYDRKFFDYPLKPINALARPRHRRLAAGPAQLPRGPGCSPIRPERSFEDWVVNRFGRGSIEIFFKTYTEKVWGMPVRRDRRALGRPADQGTLARHAPSTDCPVRRPQQGRG